MFFPSGIGDQSVLVWDLKSSITPIVLLQLLLLQTYKEFTDFIYCNIYTSIYCNTYNFI